MNHDQTDHPGVLIRPPRLYLGALIAGVALHYLWPLGSIDRGLRFGLGPVLVVAGLGLAVLAMRRFARAGTNVPTPLPATALVTGGIYRYSRNPIYVGLSALYLGLALIAGSAWALILLIPVLLIMRTGVIGREERYLQAKFGADYDRYRAQVRRWI